MTLGSELLDDAYDHVDRDSTKNDAAGSISDGLDELQVGTHHGTFSLLWSETMQGSNLPGCRRMPSQAHARLQNLSGHTFPHVASAYRYFGPECCAILPIINNLNVGGKGDSNADRLANTILRSLSLISVNFIL